MEEGYFELENYGVKLKRLTHDKIEMVRQWRNDPKISQFMFYKEYISPEMQERWFANLDKKCNFYFIVEYDGKDIGLINIRDVDWDIGCGEPGIFIYDEFYLNGDIPTRAYLCMADFGFDTLKIRALQGHILRDNYRAIRFNKSLGFVLAPNQENVDLQLWVLHKDIYKIKTQKVRDYLCL